MNFRPLRWRLHARHLLALCLVANLAYVGWDYLFGLHRLVMPSCWDGRYLFSGLVELEGAQNDWFREEIRNSGFGYFGRVSFPLGNNGIRFDSEGYAYISRWDWYAQDRNDVLLNLSQHIADAIEEKHRKELMEREDYRRTSQVKTHKYLCDWMKAVTLEPPARPQS